MTNELKNLSIANFTLAPAEAQQLRAVVGQLAEQGAADLQKLQTAMRPMTVRDQADLQRLAASAAEIIKPIRAAHHFGRLIEQHLQRSKTQ